MNAPGRRLAVESIKVRFDKVQALDAVSHEFELEGVTGLIGVNGAGKTTLIHCLLGLQEVDSGRVTSEGVSVSYCPDTPSLEPFLTASEVLEQSRRLMGKRRQRVSQAEIEDCLSQMGLSDAIGRRAGGFSRGMKQRLAVAAALICDPDVLILDEPTSALDPIGRDLMLDVVEKRGQGRCVIFSSHILPDVERVAHRLVVLHAGHQLFDGSVREFLSQEAHSHTELIPKGSRESLIQDLNQAGISGRLSSEVPDAVLVDDSELPGLFHFLGQKWPLIGEIRFDESSLDFAFREKLLELTEGTSNGR
jgi:ABC-2 type transport system ATP-binding protein